LNEISPIGWALIGIVTIIVFSSYWSLLSMLRKKNKNPDSPSWSKSWRMMTNPWESENREMDKLSKEVANLGHRDASDEAQNPPQA
jgi:hypothetical protein